MAGILTALLIQNSAWAVEQSLQDSYQVKLAWNASVSTDVMSYRIQYGPISGAHTNSINLGNVTSATVSGLAEKVTYYYAVSALNATGLESGYSNEVSFKPGLHAAKISATAKEETIHKRAALPPLGLLTVAAILPEKWNKRLIDLNVSKLGEADLNWGIWFSSVA